MPLASALPYIAAAGMVGGTAMTVIGNKQSQDAMDKTRAEAVAKSSALQQKNNALFSASLAKSTPNTAAAQMGAGEAARTSAFNDLQSASTPIASALPASGAPTKKASAVAGSAADTWNKLVAKAGAREGSYGDWQTQQGIKNQDTAQKIGVNNNFASGDAALLPIEMQVAGQAGDKLGAWGSIASSIGSLAGMANASGAFKAAGTGVTPISQVGNYPMANSMLNRTRAAQGASISSAPSMEAIYRG